MLLFIYLNKVQIVTRIEGCTSEWYSCQQYLNVDYFETRGGEGWISKHFPNSND